MAIENFIKHNIWNEQDLIKWTAAISERLKNRHKEMCFRRRKLLKNLLSKEILDPNHMETTVLAKENSKNQVLKQFSVDKLEDILRT